MRRYGASQCSQPVRYELIFPSGVHAAGRCLHCGNCIWSWTAQGVVLAVRAACPHCGRRGVVNMVATGRVNFLFADARSLYDDAIEMFDQGKIRNAAEKAWGATKPTTDALVLAREGEEPQSAGQARRALLRLSAQEPRLRRVPGPVNTRAVSCTSTASTTGTANRKRRWPA